MKNVSRIHLEYMKIWRDDEFVSGSQKERVKVIDELRDVGHRNFIGMAVENIERQRRNQRIAHRRGLTEKMCAGDLRAGVVPCAHSSTTSLTRWRRSTSAMAAQ